MCWFVYGYSLRKLLFGGTRVHGEQRVIMLHPVAPGCFTKPDTGGQACQANRESERGRVGGSTGTNGGDSDIMVLANTHTYTHTHTCINTHHPCNWHVPQEGRNARERGSSRELIRAWIHTLRALTPHSPPACFLPVIVPCSSARETHTTRWPPNSCSLYDKFTSVVLEGATERTVCVFVCAGVCMSRWLGVFAQF